MPDSDPTHDNPRITRNLPAVVQEGEVLRPAAENWLTRAIRTLFGWKPGSVRDDLQVVLDASTPDEVGFSATERTMLRNILGLHERRIADVMMHRADIVAVKRDIPLGELMSLFESAAHRLACRRRSAAALETTIRWSGCRSRASCCSACGCRNRRSA